MSKQTTTTSPKSPTNTFAREFSKAEIESRTDAALAEGRYQIMSRYPANGTDMVVLSFCNFTNGRCDVCGGDKPGCKKCFSLTMRA
jgi:hypothetical protein